MCIETSSDTSTSTYTRHPQVHLHVHMQTHLQVHLHVHMEKELQAHVHVLTSPRTSISRITGTSTSLLVNAVDVHLHGHVDAHVLVDVLVDVAVDASVDVFVDAFTHVFVDASVDVTFYVLVDANVHAHVDERPCMLCTDLHAMYGLCSAIIFRPCMPLQRNHMHFRQGHGQVLQACRKMQFSRAVIRSQPPGTCLG